MSSSLVFLVFCCVALAALRYRYRCRRFVTSTLSSPFTGGVVVAEVPINEFGAALLRGMGWTGPTGNDGETGSEAVRDVVPRHVRLGLGAQPKPPKEVRFHGSFEF